VHTNGQETEFKFYVKDQKKVEARLRSLGAHLIQPRTHEFNLRFDLPNGRLRRQGRVLRLRQDDQARLTYKGPSRQHEGALSRQELEFTVGDFDTARQTLEALGYQVFAAYEKYRTTYQLGENLIMLDELPIGDFVEIEGPNVALLIETAHQLELDEGAAVMASYLALFERLCAQHNLDFSQLTFEALGDVQFFPDELSINPADEA
jgi:adenylate cyclase class 2